MRRISLDAFRDPMRRPRTIIWLGTIAFGLVGFMLVALGVTSTNWFCANVCHEIQGDTIAAFDRSVHANLLCYECHMPVAADPVTFMIDKVEVGAVGLYQKATKTFELPINPKSHLALEMPDRQCRQCHRMENRVVDPPDGIKINHQAHMDAGISCTTCHNRIAHPDPADGKFILAENARHQDFLTMDGCNRCHSLERKAEAPGRCSACHPKDFELRPANHRAKSFSTKKGPTPAHARLANAESKRIASLARYDAPGHGEGGGEGEELKTLEQVRECSQCHDERKFCDGCHGMTVPHTAAFKKEHGKLGRAESAKCMKCHEGVVPPKQLTARPLPMSFCDRCHHKQGRANQAWIPQHPRIVKKLGGADCRKSCHTANQCEHCHVKMIR